jgi:hypothetical protein
MAEVEPDAPDDTDGEAAALEPESPAATYVGRAASLAA